MEKMLRFIYIFLGREGLTYSWPWKKLEQRIQRIDICMLVILFCVSNEMELKLVVVDIK